jgi:hypothetical protein
MKTEANHDIQDESMGNGHAVMEFENPLELKQFSLFRDHGQIAFARLTFQNI